MEKEEIKKCGELPKEIVEKYADFLLHLELPFEALNVLRDGFKISPNDFGFRYFWAVALQRCWLLNLAEKEFEYLIKKLKDWLNLALFECKAFSKAKPGQ